MWEFLGQVIGVALGMSFIYMLMSVVIANVVESVMSWVRDLRPAMLRESLEAMLKGAKIASGSGGAWVDAKYADTLLKHPLVRGLSELVPHAPEQVTIQSNDGQEKGVGMGGNAEEGAPNEPVQNRGVQQNPPKSKAEAGTNTNRGEKDQSPAPSVSATDSTIAVDDGNDRQNVEKGAQPTPLEAGADGGNANKSGDKVEITNSNPPANNQKKDQTPSTITPPAGTNGRTPLMGRLQEWWGKCNSAVRALLATKYARPVSYISSQTFAAVLLDVVVPGNGTTRDMQALRSQIAALPDECKIRRSLLTLAENADNDLKKFRESIAHWFDETQSQVTALYRQKSGFWVTLFTALVVLLLNVDSLRIASSLWNDPSLRKQIEAKIDEELASYKNDVERQRKQVGQAGDDRPPPAAEGKPNETDVAKDTTKAAAKDAAKVAPKDASKDAPQGGEKTTGLSPNEAGQKIVELREQMIQMGLPIGWSAQDFPAELRKHDFGSLSGFFAGVLEVRPGHLPGFLKKLAGLATTVFAVSLGAPFWFDLLNKLVNIRSAVGHKPTTLREEQAKKDSKDES